MYNKEVIPLCPMRIEPGGRRRKGQAPWHKPSVNREGRLPPERNASAQPMQIPSGRGGGAIPVKKPLPGVSEGAFYLACHRKWLMLFP